MIGVALKLSGIGRRFRQGEGWLEVLRGVDLELAPGAVVALMGPSGSGKSTLLQIAGLLERPDAGEVLLDGRACGQLSDAERTRIRRERLGFVYQFHHLLPEFSALENAEMPIRIARRSPAEARATASALLGRVGLAERLDHRPSMLSGGEQQRVAVARALVMQPALVLADEPTGDLDETTGDALHDLFREMHRERGLTSVIATHNPRLAASCDRILRLEAGRLVPA
jgi:lipoprotein-releasing system ATP-binding protein